MGREILRIIALSVFTFVVFACKSSDIAEISDAVTNSVQTEEEQQVIQTSAFYPGEQPPEVAAMAVFTSASTSETGTIGGPNGGSPSDGGYYIPGGGGSSSGGGTSSGGSSSGSTGGSTSSDGTTSGGSSSGGSSTTADNDTGSTGGSSSDSGTDGGSTSNTDPAGGSDSGTIANGDNGGADGGNQGGSSGDGSSSDGSTTADNGTADNGGDTGSNGDSSNGGSTGTDVADNGTNSGNDGGSTDSGNSSNGADTSGTDSGNTDGGSTTADNDGGSNTDGGTTGTDGGSNSDGGNSSGGDSTTADNGTNSGNGGNTGGSTDSGSNSGDTNSGSTTADNGGSSSSGGSSTDGGSTDGNTNNGGSSSDGGTTTADGGSTTGGTTSGGTDTGSTDNGNNGGSVDDGSTTAGTDDQDGDTNGGQVNDDPIKVPLCHIPPGNPYNAHIINIDEHAVSAHLAHGDQLGTCPRPECLGGKCPNQLDEVDFKISRVCSQARSRIAYPKFIFFEEARNPIVSLEASVTIYEDTYRKKELPETCLAAPIPYIPTSGHSSGALKRLIRKLQQGFSKTASRHKYRDDYRRHRRHAKKTPIYVNMLVASRELSRIDLFEGQYRGKLEFSIEEMATEIPKDWQNAMVSVRICDDTNRNGLCSDEVGARMLSINQPSFKADHVPRTLSMDVWHGRHMLLKQDPEFCEKQYSPIVLDLAGNGIKLSGPGDGGILFDLNDTGSAVYTGWVSGRDDAFLVRDVNGNGSIDSGAELFGSATKLRDGSRAADGFVAMRELDENGDNFLTPSDSAWKDLRLWVDNNFNGISEKGEILGLDKLNVESINLAHVDMDEVDEFGNETRMRSTFRRRIAGRSYALMMIDVWFNTLVRQEDQEFVSQMDY